MTFLLFALVLIVFVSIFVFFNKKKQTKEVEILHIEELAPESTPEPTVVAEIAKVEVVKKVAKKKVAKKEPVKKVVKKSSKK